MLLVGQPKRRRTPKRLSHPESARFVTNIQGLLKSSPYGRTRQLADMLGCDRRTAQRFLNAGDKGVPRLRKVYVSNAVKATGISMMALVNSVPELTEIQERMARINENMPQLDQFKELSNLGASMAARCMYGYQMPARYTVDCDANLKPMEVKVEFRKGGVDLTDFYAVTITRDTADGWRLEWSHPEFGNRFRGKLNDANFESILKFVKHS